MDIINLSKLFFSIFSKFFLKFKKENFVDFPLNLKKVFTRFLIKFDKHKYFYFVRVYSKKLNNFEMMNYDLSGLSDKLTYEILKSEDSVKEKEFQANEDGILFFSSSENNNNFKLSLEGTEIFKSNFNKFENLKIKYKKNQKIKFSSKKETLFSKNFYFQKNLKQKLNLILFIDGLPSNEFYNDWTSKNCLKNTKEFFSNGYHFRNHFSNGEWSLPSGGNFFTGCYLDKHQLYHPEKNVSFSNNLENLAEIFSKNLYYTHMINGSHRLSPMYGFIKGFDRTLYKRQMKASDVVNHFIEFDKILKGKKFVWLTFWDLHFPRNNPGFEYDLFETTKIDKKVKSPYETENKIMKNIFYNKLTIIDENLSLIYKYIEKNYTKEEINVHLFSDHGQSYFDNNNHLLKDGRIKTPWVIMGNGIEQKNIINDITENIDIFPTILKQNNILDNSLIKKIDGKVPKSLDGEKKKYAITQSLYPNQTYKMRIDFEDIAIFFETIEKTNYNCQLNNFMDVTCNLEQKININDKLINIRKTEAKKIFNKMASNLFTK